MGIKLEWYEWPVLIAGGTAWGVHKVWCAAKSRAKLHLHISSMPTIRGPQRKGRLGKPKQSAFTQILGRIQAPAVPKNDTHQTSGSGLMRLPVELRRMIYDMVFDAELRRFHYKPYYLYSHRGGKLLVNSMDIDPAKSKFLAIALACRQTYIEAPPRLYSHPKLVLRPISNGPLKSLLERVPSQHLSWLSQLTVQYQRHEFPGNAGPLERKRWYDAWRFYHEHLNGIRLLEVGISFWGRFETYLRQDLNEEAIIKQSDWLLPALKAPMHVRLMLHFGDGVHRLTEQSCFHIPAILDEARIQVRFEGGRDQVEDVILRRACMNVHARMTGSH